MRIKKILSLLVATLMIFSMFTTVTFAADEATLTVSSATAKAGDTVEITVTAANNPGMVSAYITLNYDDEALELVNVTDSGVWPGQLHSPTYNVNPYTLSWDNGSAPANITANGVLATLTFKVKEDAVAGDYNVSLAYDIDNLEIMDFDFNGVEFDLVAGKVTVEAEGGNEPPATDAATLTVGSATAAAGDIIEVPVTAANNPGMVSAYITLNFDDALELVGVTDSGVWPGQLHSPTYNVNPYTLSWDNGSAPANITANGVLATLKFKVKETAAAGDYNIWLSYDPDNLEIMDFDFNPVYFDLVAGKVTVEGAAAPATYDVVFVADGETVATKTVNVGDKLAVADFPEVPAKAGYTGAWNVTEDITAATTVEAVYTRNTFTVTFVADGETVATKTVNEGEALAVANFPAVPAKAGYAGAWDVTTDITGAATVTAVYTAKVYGDVDGDGEVATLVDLMTLERYLAHWLGYDEIVEINADLDEDGFVTVIDVMILAKHIADWSGFEELPCK